MTGLSIRDVAFLSAAAGFSPLDLPNLVGWWDAADASTITSSGSPLRVSQWDDKSGLGYHFTQSTAAAQPTTGSATQNGRNVLSFDGGDWLRLGSSNLGRNTSGLTAYAVIRNSSVPTSQQVILRVSRPDLDFARVDLNVGLNAANIRLGGRTLDANAFQTIFGTTPIGTSWYTFTGVFDYANTDLFAYLGSTLEASSTTFQSASTTSDTASVETRVGAGGTSPALGFFLGEVAEILMYHSAHDSATRTTVWSYLNEKWGL